MIVVISITLMCFSCLPTVAQSDTYAIQFDQSRYSVSEDGQYAILNLTLDRPFDSHVWWLQVYYNTRNGTANNVTNFLSPVNASSPDPMSPAHSAIFEYGDLCKTIRVPILNDDRYHSPDLNFMMSLTYICSPNITGIYGSNKDVTITILEASPTVQFKTDSYRVDGDKQTAMLNVTISHAAKSDVIVHYRTADSTAVDGANYTGTMDGTITFPAGSTSDQCISVPIIRDSTQAGNTQFNVYLMSVDNEKAGIGNPQSITVTIVTPVTENTGPNMLLILLMMLAPLGGIVVFYFIVRNK
ncbi:MAG TPA: Calx-beta domain-containing protein [Methanocella sp.]|jgi:hypothetical protein